MALNERAAAKPGKVRPIVVYRQPRTTHRTQWRSVGRSKLAQCLDEAVSLLTTTAESSAECIADQMAWRLLVLAGGESPTSGPAATERDRRCAALSAELFGDDRHGDIVLDVLSSSLVDRTREQTRSPTPP